MIARTGRPNGLTIDRDGVLWVAESVNPPSLLCVTMDGKTQVVMTGCDGEPFLFPNDLCFGPDGALYMTDSGVLGYLLQHFQVFRFHDTPPLLREPVA